jgi:copper homeostasis protein
MLLEICVDSIYAATVAQNAGADRIELCANLNDGGTTPSYGMIVQCRKKISIPIHVMIRPRSGDFLFDDNEFEEMKADISIAKKLKAEGVVIGMLTENGEVDIERTTELVRIAYPLHVTFHRAFDMATDPFQALEDIMEAGCNTLLTSGHRQTALDGAELIYKLGLKAGNKINIMAGSGITDKNILELALKTKTKCFHASAKKSVESNMLFKNNNINLGSIINYNEYQKRSVDADMIKNIKQKLFSISQS